MGTGTLAALALTIVMVYGPCFDPERAPESIRCPDCRDRTWVTVLDENEFTDNAPIVVDCLGHTHWHDWSWHEWNCRCCRCGLEFTIRWEAGPCWCGASREHPVPMPTCDQSQVRAMHGRRVSATVTPGGRLGGHV